MRAKQIVERMLEDRLASFYHAAPGSRVEAIQKSGLEPRREKRGLGAASDQPAIYFFRDLATAEDAVSNWLMDEWPETETEAVVFECRLPDNTVIPDPELSGSYLYIGSAIPPEQLKIVATWPL